MLPHHGLKRASTGVDGLDRMLDGGLIAGRTYILAGDAGSGRSTICGHFLMDGVKKGEDVLYVTVDSPPADISANLSSFNWDPGKIIILNAHPRVREYKVRGSLLEVTSQSSVGALADMGDEEAPKAGSAADLSLPTLQLMLKKEFESKSYNRLVIDSIISLKLLGAQDIQWELGINSILRLLMEEGVTTLIVSDTPKRDDPLRPEFLMAHGIIRTHRFVVNGKVYRGVFVEKMRGSAHDMQMRPLDITPKGVEVSYTKTLMPEIISQLSSRYPLS
jgi:KaiC/GvpD/RAD55 family RecA-like ATPase